MDKYKLTDDNQELDDVSRLIHELKDLSVESAVEPRTEDYSEYQTATEPERPVRKPKPANKDGLLPIWKVALIDLLVGGAIILTFAFFHHVLPAMNTAKARQEDILLATEPAFVVTEPATETSSDAPVEAATEVPTEVPTEPDTRTEWQKKFAEHFSDEIIRTENSYKSPNVSITVETVSYGEGRNKQTYHVADIYIASMENFVTYTANNQVRSYDTQDVLEMSQVTDSLITIGGDFITYQKGGFLVRNGIVYKETTNSVSICALFPDGTMETYEPREYTTEDIKNRGALQVWSFGPTLLDENGQVRKRYDMPRAVSHNNPRSAIGYYEPGHYCFVVADGRQEGYAKGLTIPDLAKIFADLGCTKAYNLDGGGSAVMTFDQKMYSKQSNGGRDLGDILLIREAPAPLATQAVSDATVTGEGVG